MDTSQESTPVRYSVLVSNIGWVVTDETDKHKAEEIFEEYVQSSKIGRGKAGSEDVTLWSTASEDSIAEYYAPIQPEA